jgi:hypothetical protein
MERYSKKRDAARLPSVDYATFSPRVGTGNLLSPRNHETLSIQDSANCRPQNKPKKEDVTRRLTQIRNKFELDESKQRSVTLDSRCTDKLDFAGIRDLEQKAEFLETSDDYLRDLQRRAHLKDLPISS